MENRFCTRCNKITRWESYKEYRGLKKCLRCGKVDNVKS